MLRVRFSVKERVFPCTLGIFSIKEYFLVLWVRLALKRESVSLYFGHVLALKRESIY
jgi:hypothetical protein